MADSAFENTVAITIVLEGGDRVVTDSGGMTKFGISQRAYPGLDIAALSEEQARAIYLQDFWLPLGLDRFAPAIAMTLFDAAVNLGGWRSVRLMQQALNILGAEPGLKLDGVLGPKTLAAVGVLAGSPERQFLLAWQALNERLDAYCALAGRQAMRPYLRGWARRCAALGRELGHMAQRGTS